MSARADDGSLSVVGVLGERTTASVQAFLVSIPDSLKATIHSVCVDMYEAYHQAVKRV